MVHRLKGTAWRNLGRFVEDVKDNEGACIGLSMCVKAESGLLLGKPLGDMKLPDHMV